MTKIFTNECSKNINNINEVRKVFTTKHILTKSIHDITEHIKHIYFKNKIQNNCQCHEGIERYRPNSSKKKLRHNI